MQRATKRGGGCVHYAGAERANCAVRPANECSLQARVERRGRVAVGVSENRLIGSREVSDTRCVSGRLFCWFSAQRWSAGVWRVDTSRRQASLQTGAGCCTAVGFSGHLSSSAEDLELAVPGPEQDGHIIGPGTLLFLKIGLAPSEPACYQGFRRLQGSKIGPS